MRMAIRSAAELRPGDRLLHGADASGVQRPRRRVRGVNTSVSDEWVVVTTVLPDYRTVIEVYEPDRVVAIDDADDRTVTVR